MPEHIDAKPDAGNDFCILHWDWRNVGTKPGNPTHAASLVIGDEEFAQSGEDQMRSWTIMATHLNVQYAEQVNPRGKTKSLDIYQIPSGEEPTAVWFPERTLVSEPYILVATK